jgi:hypothetical protein
MLLRVNCPIHLDNGINKYVRVAFLSLTVQAIYMFCFGRFLSRIAEFRLRWNVMGSVNERRIRSLDPNGELSTTIMLVLFNVTMSSKYANSDNVGRCPNIADCRTNRSPGKKRLANRKTASRANNGGINN